MVPRVTREEKKMLVDLAYVEFEYDIKTKKEKWTCKKCHHVSHARHSRALPHLFCEKNKNVKICKHMEEHSDEREELARRLGRDSSFPRGHRGMCMGDPMLTPDVINFIDMCDGYIPLSQDGATVDPSMAASSMDIEGQIWDVISNGCANQEDHSNVPDLGSAGREGGASPDVQMRMQNAVSLEKGSKKRKCAPGSGTSATAWQLDDSEQSPPFSVSNFISTPPETPDASMSVPRETCTPPSHGQERACVPNRNNGVVQGTNAVGSELLNTMPQPARTVIPMDETYSTEAMLEDNNDGVQGQNVGSSIINTIHQAQEEEGSENCIGQNTFGAGSCQPQTSSDIGVANVDVQAPQEEGRENGRGCNTFGAGSCQPRTPTHSTQLRFDTVQPINEQDASRAPLTNLNEIEAMLNEAVKEHLRITLSSSAEQQQYHESTSSCENQLRTDLEPSASHPQVRSSMQSSGNCNFFDPGSSQGTEDFASLAERFRELSQQEVDARRKLVQDMLYLVKRLKGLTSKQADLKTQLEEKESFTVKKRKQEVDNWLGRVDEVKEEVVDEINQICCSDVLLSFHRSHGRRSFTEHLYDGRTGHSGAGILGAGFSLEDLLQKISKARFSLKDLERKNNRIDELRREVVELLEEGKLLLELTVDVVMQRKVVNCRSQLQHFIDQHFSNVILEMT